MRQYVFKRFLLFVPTLLVISLVSFWIITLSPSLPVTVCDPAFEQLACNPKQIQQELKKFDLHLPTFYFSIQPLSYPDTLYRLFEKDQIEAAKHLVHRHGCWPQIQGFRVQAGSFQLSLNALRKELKYSPAYSDSTADQLTNLAGYVSKLKYLGTTEQLGVQLDLILHSIEKNPAFTPLLVDFGVLQNRFEKIEAHHQGWKTYFPSIAWHGTENRYHTWDFRCGGPI